MKSQTILFKKKDLGHIRVIGGNKNPLFCLRDVCDILGVKNYKDVVKLITDEFGDQVSFSYPIVNKQGKIHKVPFISEPQLYFILIRSDSSKAYLLRQWVKLEIAPQIKQQKEIQMIDTKEKTRNNTFTFNGLPITVIDKEGEPWFITKEVCKVLGISKYRDAISSLDEDERCPVKVDTLGGEQDMTAISESGLYALIMRSNKPQAKAFRKWVINEVLVQLPSGHKENNKQLQVFNFNNTKLDYAVLNNEPLFNLNNIANILNISNPRTSIDANDNDYVIKLDSSVVGLTYNRNLNNRGELFLTEAGLYKLIMTSKKKEAEAFQKWVHTELLPQIKQQKEIQMIDTKEKIENTNEFTFNNLPITVIEKDGAPWFVAKEVCKILEISNASKAVNVLDDDEKVITKSYTLGGEQDMVAISESGLYTLIIRSNKPQAKAFRKWVTAEVLPTIRKTGSYQINGSTMSDEDRLMKLKELDIRSKEADAELQRLSLIRFEHYNKLAERYKDINNGTYSQILDSYATKELTGEHILPLPELPEKYYSAGEVGKLLGISANKVGRLANTHKLKNEQYGKWFADKSPYSTKEVQTFKYNNNFISFIKGKL